MVPMYSYPHPAHVNARLEELDLALLRGLTDEPRVLLGLPQELEPADDAGNEDLVAGDVIPQAAGTRFREVNVELKEYGKNTYVCNVLYLVVCLLQKLQQCYQWMGQ